MSNIRYTRMEQHSRQGSGRVPEIHIQNYGSSTISSLQSSEARHHESQSQTYSSQDTYSSQETYPPPPGSPPGHGPSEKYIYQTLNSPSSAPEVVPEQFGLYHTQPQQHGHHRSLSPAFSQSSTNVGSPYIGSEHIEEGKEVYQAHVQPVPTQEEKKKICGMSRIIFGIALVILLLVLAGVGAGLGVGLGTKKSNGTSTSLNPDYYIGGALNPAYYSTKGAFNGTGIAFAGEQGDNSVRVYFQHHSGDLRWLQLDASGNWIGGSKTETVATDAKNSTPISVVAYSLGDIAQRHLFYIDKNGYVRQRSNSNVTNIWQEGPLNALNLTAFDADSVGLQACYYGNFYGDSDYHNFPTPTGAANNESFATEFGMHLWYATDNTTFEQWGFREGQAVWQDQKTWAGFNGHAGVGCYSWGPGTTTYAMMVNLHNSVEIWWKDTNTTTNSSDSHPINSWQNASNAAIPDVLPSTSLGYTTFFYAQQADYQVHGYNISYNAENTTIMAPNTFTVGDTTGPVDGVPGTHLTVSAVSGASGGAQLYIFYQTEGDDITLFTRDLKGGQQTSGKLPIPLA